MRIWDIPPSLLCRQHLLGEHRELHCIFTVLLEGKSGYSRHPETLRWAGRLNALRERHEALVREMSRRGYNHHSDLPIVNGQSAEQSVYIDSPERQREILLAKGCECRVTEVA